MRQIIEVLRLKYESGLSHERIARACGISKGVVGKYVSLAKVQLGIFLQFVGAVVIAALVFIGIRTVFNKISQGDKE